MAKPEVGQEREAVNGDRITLVGCYGYGSEGALFAFKRGGILSPNGISEADVERDYPVVATSDGSSMLSRGS